MSTLSVCLVSTPASTALQDQQDINSSNNSLNSTPNFGINADTITTSQQDDLSVGDNLSASTPTTSSTGVNLYLEINSTSLSAPPSQADASSQPSSSPDTDSATNSENTNSVSLLALSNGTSSANQSSNLGSSTTTAVTLQIGSSTASVSTVYSASVSTAPLSTNANGAILSDTTTTVTNVTTSPPSSSEGVTATLSIVTNSTNGASSEIAPFAAQGSSNPQASNLAVYANAISNSLSPLITGSPTASANLSTVLSGVANSVVSATNLLTSISGVDAASETAAGSNVSSTVQISVSLIQGTDSGGPNQTYQQNLYDFSRQVFTLVQSVTGPTQPPNPSGVDAVTSAILSYQGLSVDDTGSINPLNTLQGGETCAIASTFIGNQVPPDIVNQLLSLGATQDFIDGYTDIRNYLLTTAQQTSPADDVSPSTSSITTIITTQASNQSSSNSSGSPQSSVLTVTSSPKAATPPPAAADQQDNVTDDQPKDGSYLQSSPDNNYSCIIYQRNLTNLVDQNVFLTLEFATGFLTEELMSTTTTDTRWSNASPDAPSVMRQPNKLAPFRGSH